MGDFIAIMGPSGSGKTTLMNIIGLLDTPTKGKYLLDGLDVSTLDDNEMSQLRNKKIRFYFSIILSNSVLNYFRKCNASYLLFKKQTIKVC